MNALFLLGRAIFGGYFVYNGINHFQNREMLAGYAGSKGVPAPQAAVPATGAMMLAGGASVLTGTKPRLGLAAIIAFLVPTSLIMHRYWQHADAQQRIAEQVNFTKNLALVGAALMMMRLPQPWPASIALGESDDVAERPRFSARHLQALPA